MVTQLCPTLYDSMDWSLPGSSAPWDFLGKNTVVGCHFLVHKIFWTQGLNSHFLHLLHCWQILFRLIHHCCSVNKSCPTLQIPWTSACRVSLSLTTSWSLSWFMSTESVDPGLIPGVGRSAGEGIGYPLQYSWASLVAQTIKNLPAMIPGLGRSPREGNPLQCSDLENSMDMEIENSCSLAGYSPWGWKESDTTEWLSRTLCIEVK